MALPDKICLPIPIKTQKILRFVPVLNIAVTYFCVLYMYRKNYISNHSSRWMKFILKLFAAMLACAIPLITVNSITMNETLQGILTVLFELVMLYCGAAVNIREQQKLIAERDEEIRAWSEAYKTE